MASAEQSSGKTTSHWFILILLALAQFMVVLDVSIVNVALPAIQKAFHLSQDNLQWVITAYTLTFGGFLLLGGRAADLLGRRRAFLSGIVLFTLASLGTGLSQSGSMLIVFRGLQGLGGAFMSPAALSIVLVTYKEGHERNLALSVWAAVASGGAAVGVLLGGVITQYLTWRWNFFINIPVGIFVIVTALRVLDKHESEADHNDFDFLGALSITGSLMSLVYGLVQAPEHGWTSQGFNFLRSMCRASNCLYSQ
jgi:MFS family permease